MIIDIFFIFAILLFGFIGAKKGFVDTVLGIASRFLIFAFILLFTKPLSNFLATTSLYDLFANLLISDTSAITAIQDKVITWILAIVAFFILLIIGMVVMKLIRKFANFITGAPGLKQVNGVCGAVLWGFGTLCFLCIGLGIVQLMESMALTTDLYIKIQDSCLTKYLYENNFIINMIFSVDTSSVADVVTTTVENSGLAG